jgi:predicted DNA-binding transcriptional regulator YafY
VSERLWSDDQKIIRHSTGGIILKFSATSRQEVISWVLSFGTQAELIAPEDLRWEFREKLGKMSMTYAQGSSSQMASP